MSLVGFIGELGLKRMKCNGKWIMTLARKKWIMAYKLSTIAMECKFMNSAKNSWVWLVFDQPLGDVEFKCG